MGYRIRLGRIPKFMKEHFVGLDYKEATKKAKEIYESTHGKIYDEEDFFAFYHDLPHYEELYEIGKYISYEDGREPFFSFDIYEEEGTEFDIFSKEGLKRIIESYHDNTLKHYQELLENLDIIKNQSNEYSFIKLKDYFTSKLNEWGNKYGLKPYRLDEDSSDGFMTGSWKIEYAIFNLTYIYRTFDWENDYLIYSGW